MSQREQNCRGLGRTVGWLVGSSAQKLPPKSGLPDHRTGALFSNRLAVESLGEKFGVFALKTKRNAHGVCPFARPFTALSRFSKRSRLR